MRTFILTLFLAASVQAQQYDRLLLPVVVNGEIPGDAGSRWTSVLALTNAGILPIDVLGYEWAPEGCGIATCPPAPLTPAGVTFYPSVGSDGTRGAILLVEASRSRDLRAQLRIRDLSRALETWGTELPVVNASTLASGPVSLLDIPVDPAFRLTLRVYDLGAPADGRVLVRLWSTNESIRSPVDPFEAALPDVLIAEREYPLTLLRHDDSQFDFAQLQTSDLAGLAASHPRIRLEIIPLALVSRLWAFVSVTNNTTQHVTTITPLR